MNPGHAIFFRFDRHRNLILAFLETDSCKDLLRKRGPIVESRQVQWNNYHRGRKRVEVTVNSVGHSHLQSCDILFLLSNCLFTRKKVTTEAKWPAEVSSLVAILRSRDSVCSEAFNHRLVKLLSHLCIREERSTVCYSHWPRHAEPRVKVVVCGVLLWNLASWSPFKLAEYYMRLLHAARSTEPREVVVAILFLSNLRQAMQYGARYLAHAHGSRYVSDYSFLCLNSLSAHVDQSQLNWLLSYDWIAKTYCGTRSSRDSMLRFAQHTFHPRVTGSHWFK
jgi:hypothetical protein